MHSPALLPFLTPLAWGCGGLIKQAERDFIVEEIPSYLPAGSGEHLYLLVEKRGITTRQLLKRVGSLLNLRPAQIGYAGLKDARAITRQWISLHVAGEPALAALESPQVAILRAERHGNKLRRGHLRGNRFRVAIRRAAPPPDFAGLWQTLGALGFPNYFGPQRFGADGDNAIRGLAVLRKGKDARGNLEQNRFFINAFQSALFNDLVAKRILEHGRLDALIPGDLAVFRTSRSFFLVKEGEIPEARARAAKGELSASAPLFGYKSPLAGGKPGDWEREALAAKGLCLEDFGQGGKKLSQPGERRAVRAFPELHSWRAVEYDSGTSLELDFSLPPGVYATSFLRELMKTDTGPASTPSGIPAVSTGNAPGEDHAPYAT